VSNNQQPGWPQQPNNQQRPQPENGASYPPIRPAPEHGDQPQFPPYAQQPGQQYGQAPMVAQAPPKTGMPVWGWVACGVAGLAIIAAAGAVVFNRLAGGGKDLVAAPDATASCEPAAAVYLLMSPISPAPRCGLSRHLKAGPWSPSRRAP
jgi:hypothetical protein